MIDFTEEEPQIDFLPDVGSMDRASRKSDLQSQMLEARIEAEQGKATEGLIDFASGASKVALQTAAKVLPSPVISPVMNQLGVPENRVLPPDVGGTISDFLKEGLGYFGVQPETAAPFTEFAGENAASLPELAPQLMLGKFLPKDVGRMFQAQMGAQIPQSLQQLAGAESPEERVKAGLGLAANVAFPAAIEKGLQTAPTPVPDIPGSVLNLKRGARVEAPVKPEVAAEQKPVLPWHIPEMPDDLPTLVKLRTEVLGRLNEIEESDKAKVKGTQFEGQTSWQSIQQTLNVLTDINTKIAYLEDVQKSKSPTPTPVAEAKQPWEMTQDEFVKEHKAIEAAWQLDKSKPSMSTFGKFHGKDYQAYVDAGKFGNEVSTLSYEQQKHKSEVRNALAEGKPVPPEVLADYPDLKPPEPAAPVAKVEAQVKKELWQMTPREAASITGMKWEKWQDAVSDAVKEGKLDEDSDLYKAMAKTGYQDWRQLKAEAQTKPLDLGPGMVGMGGALEGEVKTGAGADIYGIAQRVREARAESGQVDPIEPGKGISAEESVLRGRKLLDEGYDVEKAMAKFEKTGALDPDAVMAARAHGEVLARIQRQVEQKFGTESSEFLAARKALSDWDRRSKAMATSAHKSFMAHQGETDIDTGTFTGIERAYREVTDKNFDPAQANTAKKIVKGVSEADKAVEDAKPRLEKEIDKIGSKVEPHIRRLADKIIEAMDSRANSALARIKARQAQGRAFSVLDPQDLDDVIIYGAAKITKGVVEFGAWSAEMIRDIGEGIRPYLKEAFDRATKLEDEQTTKLAGGDVEKVKASRKVVKAPTDIKEQRKSFQDYKGGPMSDDQLKTLWSRAKTEYIDKGNESMADTVNKLGTDFGLLNKDVLKGLNQTRTVKRIADDIWQKQRQARLLKQSAKRWVNNAQETWLQKVIPTAAKVMFSAKVGFHGTVAMGTHAPLVLATHPEIFARNFGKMYKLVASPDYYNMQVHELQRRKNYNVANRAKLVNDPTKLEDFNDPKLAQGFPKLANFIKSKLGPLGKLQGMGTRGYTVLKILRQDLFDHEWDKLAKSEQTPEMAKAIADSVNHITGVTETKLPDTANLALFAPKLLYSRLQVMAGDPLRAANSLLKGENMTPEQKWFAMNQFKEKAKIFGTAVSLLTANQVLNNLVGDKKKLNGVPEFMGGAGFNPMASDFMKLRVAGMNVAWASPFLTMSRLPARLIQIGMGSGGKTRFLIYPDESMYKTLGSYARTQTSPLLSPIISLVTKADYEDRPLPKIPGYGEPPPMPKRLAARGVKPYTWPEFAAQTILPIPFQEGAKEVWHYGLGATPKQQDALMKAFVIILLNAGTGARIQEDWTPK